MKLAQYRLNKKDIKEINNFHLPFDILHKYPWIDSPWLCPTWEEVNKHLELAAGRAKKTTGIFRAWSSVSRESRASLTQQKKAIQSFYESSTYVSANFT